MQTLEVPPETVEGVLILDNIIATAEARTGSAAAAGSSRQDEAEQGDSEFH